MTTASNNTVKPKNDPANARALHEALRLSFGVLRVVMIVLLALTLLRSSLFVVSPQQKAFVLRFGRIAGTGERMIKSPGPHLSFPAPVDEIVRIPGEQMLTVVSDSFHHGLDDHAGGGTPPRNLLSPYFRATMTADRNLLHSRWTLRYTVDNPEAYAFSFRNMELLLRMELDRAVIRTMARTEVDRALRADRELAETIEMVLAQRVNQLGLGIRIHQVESERIAPPPAIADAFDNVIMAEQESNELLSQARIDAARTIGDARATAAARLARAKGRALLMSNTADADAAALSSMLEAGIDSPDNILARAMLTERISRMFQGADSPYVIRLRSAPAHREIRIQLSGEKTERGN